MNVPRSRRSLSASWRPWALARWSRRWASKLLPPRLRSKRKSRPSRGGQRRRRRSSICVDLARGGRTSPRAARRACRAARPWAARAGSSSNDRHSTSTSSAVREARQRGLEAALADVAPRADDVGPDLDLHGRWQPRKMSGDLPADGFTRPSRGVRPADDGRIRARVRMTSASDTCRSSNRSCARPDSTSSRAELPRLQPAGLGGRLQLRVDLERQTHAAHHLHRRVGRRQLTGVHDVVGEGQVLQELLHLGRLRLLGRSSSRLPCLEIAQFVSGHLASADDEVSAAH